MFSKLTKKFSNKIGIDLGTANTLVYLSEHGIVVNEPSIVAMNRKTERIVAVGNTAREMLGRNPEHLTVIRPLSEGVISDFEIAEEMIGYFINRAEEMDRRFFRPTVLIGIPSGVTNVEQRAVFDAAYHAGVRECFLIEEPMAGAIAEGLPIHDATGSMVIDIGGGTTDIAVISLDGIAQSKNLKVAGDVFNQDIMLFFREKLHMLIGERSADDIKRAIMSADSTTRLETQAFGRDMMTGLPKQITVKDTDIMEATQASMEILLDSVAEVLEKTPPELVSDISRAGIHLFGGGALIRGIGDLISRHIGIPVHVSAHPLESVARGTGIILENLSEYLPVLIKPEDHD